jgi:hypothetical protein
MIVKLIQDYTYLGVDFKKGTTVAMPRRLALIACQDGIAVSNEDVPCPERAAMSEKQRFSKAVQEAEDKAIEQAETADIGIPKPVGKWEGISLANKKKKRNKK